MSLDNSSPNPHFVFGGNEKKSSIPMSSATAQPDVVVSKTTSTSARDVLMQLQKDNEEGETMKSRKRKLQSTDSQVDHTLLEKGIVLRNDPVGHGKPHPYSELRTKNKDFVKSNKDTGYFPLVDHISHVQQNGLFDNLAQESILSLRSVLHMPTDPSLLKLDTSSSPDSGYGNTPDIGIKLSTLSPNSRSRSSSSETTATSSDDTISNRRTPMSSGVPSSLWSGHESVLEFVAEERREDEDEEAEEEEGDETGEQGENNKMTSNISEEDDILPNIMPPSLLSHDNTTLYTNPVSMETNFPPNELDPFYHPNDDVLIKVTKRRGIQRSSSAESRQSTPVSYGDYQTNDMRGTNKTGGMEGGRKRNSLRKRTQSVRKDSGRNALFMEGKDTFQIQDELSKDNYHFTLSDALISVIEEYKSLLHEQAYDEYLTKMSISSNSSETLCSPTQQDFIDFPDSPPVDEGEERKSTLSKLTCRESTTSLHRKWAVENYRSDTPDYPLREVSLLHLMNSPVASNSAEGTAHRLLQYVAKVLGGNSQVEFRVPQVIQLPSDFISSIKKEELLQYSVSDTSSPIRGSTDWAPPRQQIIHSVHSPPKNIYSAFGEQGNRCAGCGMITDLNQAKYFRFCNYTGKYFCVSCHQNFVSCIPAHIITKWSFKRLQVSNFARDTLANIEKEPLFNIESLNPTLYTRISEISRVREYRSQLVTMRKYIVTCSRAQSLVDNFNEYGHWTAGDIHVYSLSDFMLVKSGYLSRELKSLVSEAEKHIKTCPVCQGKGFVCEFCQKEDDIIFPFQLTKISQCPNCHCCFHITCHNNNNCPRCERIKERQQQRLKTVMFSNMNDDL